MAGFSNPLRCLWGEGRGAANGWIACPSLLSAEALAAGGWDSITVDLQHGTADYAALLTLLPVIERSGAAALVRVPWLEEASIMRAAGCRRARRHRADDRDRIGRAPAGFGLPVCA